jgi:type I restriction enzyme S subunit
MVNRLTGGSASPHLNVSDIKQFTVPLPPLHEQQQIVAEVEDQLSIIEHVESDVVNKLKATHALRQSILRDAFNGRLIPQNPNDEPASELLKRIAAEREERQLQAISTKRSSVKKKQARKRAAAI